MSSDIGPFYLINDQSQRQPVIIVFLVQGSFEYYGNDVLVHTATLLCDTRIHIHRTMLRQEMKNPYGEV